MCSKLLSSIKTITTSNRALCLIESSGNGPIPLLQHVYHQKHTKRWSSDSNPAMTWLKIITSLLSLLPYITFSFVMSRDSSNKHFLLLLKTTK